MRKVIDGKRLFVLDTNVLMHDPTAIFRFKEHDVFLPMVVLEELDAGKKGTTEVARNARQASRFIDDLIRASDGDMDKGFPLSQRPFNTDSGESVEAGNLYLQTENLVHELPVPLPGNKPDNHILGTVLALQTKHPNLTVTLVSKDINLRIKAAVLSVHAEDYFNDQVLEDVGLLYTGTGELPLDFWESHGQDMQSWQETGRSYYRLHGPLIEQWHPGQCVYLDDPGREFEAIVRLIDNGEAVLEVLTDYRRDAHAVWGIHALNREQNFALNLLMDPDIDFVSLVGVAGSGKTLLALAAGLEQAMEHNRYSEIIMTRVTVPVGEDIGFLPGTEEEKMTPWMGALMDNLEVLTKPQGGTDWARAATNDLLHSRIRIHSLNFMRGRTFLNKYLILDEAQNLTSKQMKTLITRAGPGTKVVCLGNIAQIDTPYLTETTSGLTFVVDHFKQWEHSGHITLRQGERSRLAHFASENL